MIKEIVIVEGKNDQNKLIEVFGKELKVIITNGSEISSNTLKLIDEASKKNGIILFLDPDGPGDIIRKKIEQVVTGNVKHAFLPKEKCISKNSKKIGIEHANNSDIIKAIESVYTVIDETDNFGKFTIMDMVSLGLTGCNDSKNKRIYVSGVLNIGITNTKTFVKRINQFRITIEEIEKILKEYRNE